MTVILDGFNRGNIRTGNLSRALMASQEKVSARPHELKRDSAGVHLRKNSHHTTSSMGSMYGRLYLKTNPRKLGVRIFW